MVPREAGEAPRQALENLLHTCRLWDCNVTEALPEPVLKAQAEAIRELTRYLERFGYRVRTETIINRQHERRVLVLEAGPAGAWLSSVLGGLQRRWAREQPIQYRRGRLIVDPLEPSLIDARAYVPSARPENIHLAPAELFLALETGLNTALLHEVSHVSTGWRWRAAEQAQGQAWRRAESQRPVMVGMVRDITGLAPRTTSGYRARFYLDEIDAFSLEIHIHRRHARLLHQRLAQPDLPASERTLLRTELDRTLKALDKDERYLVEFFDWLRLIDEHIRRQGFPGRSRAAPRYQFNQRFGATTAEFRLPEGGRFELALPRDFPEVGPARAQAMENLYEQFSANFQEQARLFWRTLPPDSPLRREFTAPRGVEP